MKIFIIGLPKSGRTTLAKAISETGRCYYISAMDWIKSTFRTKHKDEDNLDYERSFMDYLSERYKLHPYLISDNIEEVIQSCPNNVFVIDGLLNPQNFVKLFDYNKDMIVVLNRLDNDYDALNNDDISINVIRDYCYWLSSSNLLSKDKWIEYNFRIKIEDGDLCKPMGTRNTVYIVKSLNNAIKHLKTLI